MVNNTIINTGFDILEMYYLVRNISYTYSSCCRPACWTLMNANRTMSI